MKVTTKVHFFFAPLGTVAGADLDVVHWAFAPPKINKKKKLFTIL